MVQSRSGRCGERGDFTTLPVIEPRFIGRPGLKPSHTPTELSRVTFTIIQELEVLCSLDEFQDSKEKERRFGHSVSCYVTVRTATSCGLQKERRFGHSVSCYVTVRTATSCGLQKRGFLVQLSSSHRPHWIQGPTGGPSTWLTL